MNLEISILESDKQPVLKQSDKTLREAQFVPSYDGIS